MFDRLRTLFSAKSPDPLVTSFAVPLNPNTPFYAIGDVHGCFDQLQRLLQKIADDRQASGRENAPLIFVGDLIDRGPHSAAVLEHIKSLQEMQPEHVVCLMGNHEKMMLDFLDDPAERGPRWLRFGGVQALASYGIGGVSEDSSLDDLLEVCDALEKALPEGMHAWLRDLPLFWKTGNIFCVHAGISPRRTPTNQEERVMLWGHRDFLTTPREDDVWVLHGHTIVNRATATGGQIAIDTGAYKSGTLTAAVIVKGQCEFLQT